MMAWDDAPPPQSSGPVTTPSPGSSAGQNSPGTSWDAQPPPDDYQHSSPVNYWDDVKKNAIQGAKEIPAGAMSAADIASKVAALTSPMEWARSGVQILKGTPADQTNTAQDIAAGKQTLRSLPSLGAGVVKNLADVGVGAAQGIFTPTPWSQTTLGETFREKPLSTAATIGSLGLPVLRLLRGGVAAPAAASAGAEAAGETGGLGAGVGVSEVPGYLETKGAQGLNAIAGIRGGTIAKMTPTGQNPGVVGTQLAKTLSDEGAIGSTATETYQKASGIADQYGKSVDQALQNIQAANRGLGVYPEMEDSLKLDSNPILKPILDNANDLTKSPYPMDKMASRGWRAMYSSLSDKADANGGFLTLDHVRDEMQKVGSMYDTAGPNHIGIIDQLYGKLANVRDGMVNDIAERSGDPKLASDLLSANAGYSRYMRILPDIKKAAAMESVGQPNLSGLIDQVKQSMLSGPGISRTLMNFGQKAKGAATAGAQSAAGLAAAAAPSGGQ